MYTTIMKGNGVFTSHNHDLRNMLVINYETIVEWGIKLHPSGTVLGDKKLPDIYLKHNLWSLSVHPRHLLGIARDKLSRNFSQIRLHDECSFCSAHDTFKIALTTVKRVSYNKCVCQNFDYFGNYACHSII